jgi:hypothetical protein
MLAAGPCHPCPPLLAGRPFLGHPWLLLLTSLSLPPSHVNRPLSVRLGHSPFHRTRISLSFPAHHLSCSEQGQRLIPARRGISLARPSHTRLPDKSERHPRESLPAQAHRCPPVSISVTHRKMPVSASRGSLVLSTAHRHCGTELSQGTPAATGSPRSPVTCLQSRCALGSPAQTILPSLVDQSPGAWRGGQGSSLGSAPSGMGHRKRSRPAAHRR